MVATRKLSPLQRERTVAAAAVVDALTLRCFPDRSGRALTLSACSCDARRGLKKVFDSNGSPIGKASLACIA